MLNVYNIQLSYSICKFLTQFLIELASNSPDYYANLYCKMISDYLGLCINLYTPRRLKILFRSSMVRPQLQVMGSEKTTGPLVF